MNTGTQDVKFTSAKKKPSGRIAYMEKEQLWFYWSCSSVVVLKKVKIALNCYMMYIVHMYTPDYTSSLIGSLDEHWMINQRLEHFILEWS